MKNYNKYIESPYLMYLDMNNLNGWRMSEDFIKNCDDDSDKRMYSWSRCIFLNVFFKNTSQYSWCFNIFCWKKENEKK